MFTHSDTVGQRLSNDRSTTRLKSGTTWTQRSINHGSLSSIFLVQPFYRNCMLKSLKNYTDTCTLNSPLKMILLKKVWHNNYNELVNVKSLIHTVVLRSCQILLIFKPSACRPQDAPGFLKLLLSVTSVCVCVCVSTPKVINNY